MDLNVSAFQEPRGVMRIFQFIFAICAFATTTNFSGVIEYFCKTESLKKTTYSYPFRITEEFTYTSCSNKSTPVAVLGDFSSDAQFFVATGVLAMLYCLVMVVVYAKFDEKYKSNPQWPLADFILTVILAVFWLSGSGAWANGLNGLKNTTSQKVKSCEDCYFYSSNFSSLNISVILGFLNFFLWASDLWFLYKETEWFQQKQPTTAGSPTV